MSVAASRTLFPLETRTWVVVLVVGAGFGAVGAASLLFGGEMVGALGAVATSVTFASTAVTLENRSWVRRRGLAVTANCLLVGVAVVLAARALEPVFGSGQAAAHPVILIVTGMSVLIQAAVIVVAVESVKRLGGGGHL
ncbi:hypothetical protein [Mobilicoccus massiliensis]|uniref:hypothetical protein n=1 Tax=Mobilicoccus massiliensis TaxID=1522310 RepID=UPI00058BCFA9|nr:hypothetical protein [Mobilicoccus massiliensis]